MRRKEVDRPAGLRLFWPFKGDAFPQHNFLYVIGHENKLSQLRASKTTLFSLKNLRNFFARTVVAARFIRDVQGR